MVLPENVHLIIDTLRSAGYDAYAVGGCIRDSLLGRVPGDWDITTSAPPEAVKACFKKTVDTGIEHGTVTVLIDRVGYEVTTYRVDGCYKDGRHPESVTFTSSLEEDLMRRDFTINAMASGGDGIVDPFGGREDLEARIIRCVGDPRQRFGEDALRILRAIRFSAQLGFEIEEGTADAMRELAGTLEKISAERIRTELDKLLLSDHPEMIIEAYRLGITKVVLPEFDAMMEVTPSGKHHIYPVGEHAVEAVKKISKDPDLLRWTMLLHDVGKPSTQKIGEDGKTIYPGHGETGAAIANDVLRRLKFDNYRRNLITRLIRYHDVKIFGLDDAAFRKKISEIGPDYMEYLFMCHRADNAAKAPEGLDRVMAKIDAAYEQYRAIIGRGEPLTIGQLAVTGSDLLAAGVAPGKDVGIELARLLEIVLEDPGKIKKETLLEMISLRKR